MRSAFCCSGGASARFPQISRNSRKILQGFARFPQNFSFGDVFWKSYGKTVRKRGLGGRFPEFFPFRGRFWKYTGKITPSDVYEERFPEFFPFRDRFWKYTGNPLFLLENHSLGIEKHLPRNVTRKRFSSILKSVNF